MVGGSVEEVVGGSGEEVVEVKEAVVDVKVKKFEHNGVEYFKSSSSGLVYDKETQEIVGKWNGETIEEYEDEEESEDEYEEE